MRASPLFVPYELERCRPQELNGRNLKPASKDELVKFDDNGIPHGKICGHKLRNWGLIKKSFRRKILLTYLPLDVAVAVTSVCYALLSKPPS